MDEKLKSWIHNIVYDYSEEINDTNLEKLKKHVKCVLGIRYQYKEEIPDLEITIIEILAEKEFNSQVKQMIGSMAGNDKNSVMIRTLPSKTPVIDSKMGD